MMRTTIVCLIAAVTLTGCGNSDNGGGSGAEEPGTNEPEITLNPAPDPRSPTLKPGTRACGEIPVGDGATDYPRDIRATGVDCRTARLIARTVTIDGSSETPLNFECPDALDDEDLQKHCTKDSLEVTWEIEIQ